MKRIHILNTSIDNYTQQETLSLIDEAIIKQDQIHHAVVNAAKIVAMQSDRALRKSVNESDLISADGQAVVWASKFLGHPLKERVTGIDLMAKVVELAHKKKYRIFFFGAKEEVLKTAVNKYTSLYSPEIIAGFRNGYFSPDEESSIAAQIAATKPHVLFVGISSPIKENFLHNNKTILKDIGLIMGVGGSLDVAAGKVSRAPLWMQNNGFEWLFRLIQEPRRMWRRYLIGNLRFILLVVKFKIFKKSS
jgi:N-acetylglucosaminyldiphosphoundecaprenol N-acetyl-beta-D-mannosaminyltransferase